MTRRFTTRWLPALALVALAACDSPTEPRLGVPAVTLEAVGDAAQLTASGAEGALPVWESLDPTVVTVTPAGMAVAVRSGTATVRARLGSRTAQGSVTVLPAVEVQVADLRVVTDPGGATGIAMQLTNVGGRGYFRIDYWKYSAEGETQPTRISTDLSDREAPVGMDISFQNYVIQQVPDFAVVYSREPRSLGYEITGCVRLNGGAGCPIY